MANKSTESQIKASIRYNHLNTTRVFITLNKKTDADILQKLSEVDNKQGYVKKLIREDIKNTNDK